ncbi:MAG: hypothetical protein QOE33_3363 [Acidobacteriota bacterium]|nr:hypothetical protein [Acidobacteriota bacterium]
MEAREIGAGTQVLIGAPSQPMPQAQQAAMADALARVPGVVEAHLPQLFAPGAMSEPAQVLVVVLERGANLERTMHEITCALAQLLTEDSRLDVFPLTKESGMLAGVRDANCQILGARAEAKPWWKFWNG